MATACPNDGASLLDIVREGACAAGKELFPPRVLERLAATIPSDALVGYQEVDVSGGGCRLIERIEVLDRPVPPVAQEASRRFSRQDPLRDPSRFRESRVLKLSDFFTRRQLGRLDFYTEVWRPLGIDDCLRLWLPAPANRARVLFLERAGRDFSERDREFLELLRPHLIPIAANARFRRLTHGAFGLTDREAEVLGWVGHGMTNAAIAGILLVSPHTVRTHVGNIFAKLDVRTRAAAVAKVRSFLEGDRDGDEDGLIERHLVAVRAAVPRQTNGPQELSSREAELLAWIARGKTNSEIAEIFVLSRHTVRKHVENIFVKLGVHTRTAAVARASANGHVQSRRPTRYDKRRMDGNGALAYRRRS